MKKIVCTMLCILLVFSLSACGGNVSKVNTHNVDSEIYSEEDINAAIDTIKKEFKSNWKGCTLKEIYYAGDDSSKGHQDWADRNNTDEVIVLLSVILLKFLGFNAHSFSSLRSFLSDCVTIKARCPI